MQFGGQICLQCLPMQVAFYLAGEMNQVFDLNQFVIILAEKDYSSYGFNTLGPLCLLQCYSI